MTAVEVGGPSVRRLRAGNAAAGPAVPRREHSHRLAVLRVAAVLLFATAAGIAAGPPGPAFRYVRDVPVPTAGWLRLHLDVEALGHGAATDLRLYDPAGGELPYQFAAPESPPRQVPGRVTSVAPTDGGWWITLDLGADPPLHHRLDIDFAAKTLAPNVRVEKSRDGQLWSLLGAGDLFRIGEGADLARTGIDYPTTDARYLRLLWPAEAGSPEVKTLRAEAATPGPVAPDGYILGIDTDAAEPGSTTAPPSGASTMRLHPPGADLPLRSLVLGWTGPPDVGYRLERPHGGAWTVVAVGTLHGETVADAPRGEPSAKARIDDLDLPRIGESLRVELEAGGGATALLTSALAEFEPQWIVFDAPVAGTFRAAYGGIGAAPTDYPAQQPPVAFGDIPEVGLGPETEADVPGIPAALAQPGRALRAADFALVAPITANGATPGQVVRLEVPPEAYSTSPDLVDLRILADGLQVPFLLEGSADPSLVVSAVNAAPQAGDGGLSTIAVDLPWVEAPLSSLELVAPATPFDRLVALRFVGHASPGVEPPALGVGGSHWTCAGSSIVPCRLSVPLRRNPYDTLEITFYDGDNPPLASVSVWVWRVRHTVVFPWPPDAEPVLALGQTDLGPASYDLFEVRDDVLRRDWIPASVNLAPDDDGAAGYELSRPVFIAALALAVLVLLAILSRNLEMFRTP
jgi:hypothetical protein